MQTNISNAAIYIINNNNVNNLPQQLQQPHPHQQQFPNNTPVLLRLFSSQQP